MKLAPLFVLFGLLFPPARAEYRAFILRIQGPEGEPRYVKSSLDPDQYRGYFHVADNERITYTETWRCFGRTNAQPLCKSPREVATEAAEAATAADGSEAPTKSPESTPGEQ